MPSKSCSTLPPCRRVSSASLPRSSETVRVASSGSAATDCGRLASNTLIKRSSPWPMERELALSGSCRVATLAVAPAASGATAASMRSMAWATASPSGNRPSGCLDKRLRQSATAGRGSEGISSPRSAGSSSSTLLSTAMTSLPWNGGFPLRQR